MHRYLSFVRQISGSSVASSMVSHFAAKPPVRFYSGLGALRSHGSPLGSPCSSKGFSGLPQNKEHVRGFSSMNLGWNSTVENGSASQAFNLDSQGNINPSSQNDAETRKNSSSLDYVTEIKETGGKGVMGRAQRSQSGLDSQRNINPSSQNDAETRKSSTPMDFVRGIMETDGKGGMGSAQRSQSGLEHDADFVHIKLLRNNTFVTVTDSKGNIKLNASAGCLKEMKGGQKLSRYAAEATAEEVGRRARRLGLKSVVMKVKGFTYFKKKRQAITSWREGFTGSRGIRSPIVYIEDTTRRPHNGCRLPKKRRI